MINEQQRQLTKEEAIKKGILRGMALLREDLKMYGMKADGVKIFISESKDYDSLWEDALKKIESIPVEETTNKAEEYLNNWKRERADFVNYKKDETRRMEEFAKFANEGILIEVIEVVDDLERAVKDVKNEGLNQVLSKFQNLLTRYGLERIKTDDVFDPILHEVVEGSEGGKLEEVRAGYTMHGKVIWPARVKIIK